MISAIVTGATILVLVGCSSTGRFVVRLSENETSCADFNLDECSGICTNLDYDPNHCGDCDTICATGECCLDGNCV